MMYRSVSAVFLGLSVLGCGEDASLASSSVDGDSGVDGGQNQPAGNGGSGSGSMDASGNVPDDVDAGNSAEAGLDDGTDAALASDGSVAEEGGAGCGNGQICFELDGDPIQGAGGGYTINDLALGDYIFVKYELPPVQLSIDVFATEAGEYDASDGRAVGGARIYYFDENGTEFMSSSGSVVITSVAGGTVSGTFEGTLEEYDAGSESFTGSGPTLEVTAGTFSGVAIPAI